MRRRLGRRHQWREVWSGADIVTSLHIQTEHEILGLDNRLEHEEILVSRLTLDRCLVEAAEGVYDELLALARRSVNP